MPDYDEIESSIGSVLDNRFGWVTAQASAGYCHPLFARYACHLSRPFLVILIGGFLFAFEFARQVRMAGQRFAHPNGLEFRSILSRHHGGIFERGAGAFRAVITDQDFLEHSDLTFRLVRMQRSR